MPDIKSVMLLCSFLCFITGIFSPEIIIRWGIPSIKTRRRILALFGTMTLLFVIIAQIGETMSETEEKQQEASNVFVFSSLTDDATSNVYKVKETGFTNHLDIQIVNETVLPSEDEDYQYVQLSFLITNQLEEPYVLNLNELTLQTNLFETLTPIFEECDSETIELSANESKELALVYLQPVEESYLTVNYAPTVFSEVITVEAEEVLDDYLTTSKIGDIVEAKQALIQIHEVNRVDHQTKTDVEYLEVTLSIKNPSTRAITYYPFHFELAYDENETCIKPAIGVTQVATLGVSELVPGGMVTSKLLFEIPKDATTFTLYYHETSLFSNHTTEIDLNLVNEDASLLQAEVTLNEGWQEVESLNGKKLILTDAKSLQETKYTHAKEGEQLVLIGIELTNMDAEIHEYSAFDFKLMNAEGHLILPSLLLIDNESELTSGTLEAFESISGYLLFEDSESSEAFYLVYSPDNWKSSDCIIQPIELKEMTNE